LPIGSHPEERALIESEVVVENPTHAHFRQPIRTIGWSPMKTMLQTAHVEGETTPLKEVIPFWFAVSSPLLGALLGLLGAWFVTWLSV
jgi:hypothetical protein